MEVNNIVTMEEKRRFYRLVKEALRGRSLTAREVAEWIKAKYHITDGTRSYIQPRITELCKKGEVVKVGKKKDKYTGKTVTVYAYED